MFRESGVVHSFKMVDPVLFALSLTSSTKLIKTDNLKNKVGSKYCNNYTASHGAQFNSNIYCLHYYYKQVTFIVVSFLLGKSPASVY